MRFETTTTQLLEAVSVAARFVEKRANLPVLTGICISTEGNRALLRATNLECGVELTVPAKVLEGGSVVVPAGALLGFLSNAKDKNISLEKKESTLRVQTSRATATIKTFPIDDFPTLPHVPATSSFSCSTADLARAIKSVVYCASTSAIKPELQSVLLFGEAGKLRAAATDSFRLAEKTVPLRSPGATPQLLVPARNAVECMRILETSTGEVDVYYTENQISMHVGPTYFTTRVIDGSFPNYQQIIPKTFSSEIVVLREDFSQALKSLSVFSDKFSHLSFSVENKKKALVLSSHNPDLGEQESTIPATISGEDAAMSFNSKYLADSIQAIQGESIRIQANGPGKAILITDAADNSFRYLAMPMNR